MVDFKKLRDQDPRKEQGELQRKLHAQAKRDRRRSGIVSTQPVLETAFHRELADEAYQTALLDYVDEHWFV